jgi:hypothetical protein
MPPATLRTVEEWDSSNNVNALLWALMDNTSTRKWYCFGLACIRLIWDMLPESCRNLIDVTEWYVERKVSNSYRSRVRNQLPRIRNVLEEAAYTASAAPTDIKACGRAMPYQIQSILIHSHDPCFLTNVGNRLGLIAGGITPRSPVPGELEPIHTEFRHFLREIFPNPFREVRIEPAWLRWSDGAVRRVAETINDEGEFARVPILADALEEAGCTDEAILGHLRNHQLHLRGCWVVDLVLNKK